jgi:putative phosphoribosyl transferase
MKNEPWVVVASSFGGVYLAFKIAKVLNASFDFIFTQKIYATKNDECEIAIVTETNEIVIHQELKEAFDINLDDIYNEAKIKHNTDIKKNIENYRGDKKRISLNNQNVLLVDEGVNTGLTMMACIKSAISCDAKSVTVAVPVLPKVTIQDIGALSDDLYFVKAPAHFLTIDYYYEELEDLNLDDIKNIIKNKE